jgi:hypothetical protein
MTSMWSAASGLLTTLYFQHGDRPDVQERFAKALDHYLEVVGDTLVWGADPFIGYVKRIAGTDMANPRAWMNRVVLPSGVSVRQGPQTNSHRFDTVDFDTLRFSSRAE